MGADVHLALGTQRGDGFDGGFADDGTDFSLAVDILTHLAPNLCVDSENFCHCVLLLMLYFLFARLCGMAYMCTCGLGFERRGKSTGVAKIGIGDCGVRGR